MAVALPLAVITFLLGRVIWPDMPGAPMPSADQLPFFMFLSALESVAFGVGVGFLIFGWPYVMRAKAQERNSAVAALLAITWMLVSWWPHDNMHRVNGMDMGGLLRIEYIFHFTLIASSFIVAYFFWHFVKKVAR